MDDLAALILLYGGYATSLVMLWLFGRAFAYHRQTCLLILLTGTVCGMLYVGLMNFPFVWMADGAPRWWYVPLQTLLLLAQMILGVWGTAILLRNYRMRAHGTRAQSESRSGA
jgi:hypothetical protein